MRAPGRARRAAARPPRAIRPSAARARSSPTSSRSSPYARAVSLARSRASAARRTTLAATSRWGKSAWSWNMRPNPRRCGGVRTRSHAVEQHTPRIGHLQPGDRRAAACVFPQPLGPSTATTRRRRRRVDARRERVRRRSTTVAGPTPERQNQPARAARGPARRASGAAAVTAMQDGGERVRLRFSSPGRPRNRKIATGSVGLVRAGRRRPSRRTRRARSRTRSRPRRREPGRRAAHRSRAGTGPGGAPSSRRDLA